MGVEKLTSFVRTLPTSARDRDWRERSCDRHHRGGHVGDVAVVARGKRGASNVVLGLWRGLSDERLADASLTPRAARAATTYRAAALGRGARSGSHEGHRRFIAQGMADNLTHTRRLHILGEVALLGVKRSAVRGAPPPPAPARAEDPL